MSIELRNKVERLEQRVTELESFLGDKARQYVERHFDKVVANYAGKPEDPVAQKTLSRSTLTLPKQPNG